MTTPIPMSSASRNLMTLANADVMGTPLPTPTLPLLDHWLPHSSGDRPARAEQRDRAARATVPGVANRWLCLQHREKEGAAVEGRPVTGARASMYRGGGGCPVCACGPAVLSVFASAAATYNKTRQRRAERRETKTDRQRDRDSERWRSGGRAE